ncbi:unnamed protein product [Gadus morhua 'NCC']
MVSPDLVTEEVSCTQKKRPGNKRGENMEFEALLSPRTRGFMPGRRQPGPLITTRTAHHYPLPPEDYATRLRKPGRTFRAYRRFPTTPASPEDLVQVFWSAPASVTSEGRRRRTDLHSTS